MNIPPFPVNIQKDGRINIPPIIRKKFKLNEHEFIMVLIQKYDKEIDRDFMIEAFKQAYK